MKTAAGLIISVGAAFVWLAIYSLIDKTCSDRRGSDAMPELVFLSVYTCLLINGFLYHWFD